MRACSCLRMKAEDEETYEDVSLPLRLAWKGAEVLGNLVALVQRREEKEVQEPAAFRLIGEEIEQKLREEYDKSYFLSGDIDISLYHPDCLSLCELSRTREVQEEPVQPESVCARLSLSPPLPRTGPAASKCLSQSRHGQAPAQPPLAPRPRLAMACVSSGGGWEEQEG
eukprot:766933-Hanusia_phi.AAC.7